MDPKTSTDVRDKVVLVTGGGSGIGRAVCRAFAQAGARGVAVADVDADAARSVADGIGGLAIEVDMGDEADVQRMIARTRDTYGPIDIFCSNAGILSVGGIEASNGEWQRAWQVNFMAHVYAARDLVPEMLERGGAFVLVASAAGLLTQVGAAPYAVTKHATVAIAEWLAMTYGHRGLQVACVCPLGVRTPMLLDNLDESPLAEYLEQGAVTPEEVAGTLLEGLADGRFLVLPHPQVHEFFRRKADDYDRWLGGMNRLHRQLEGE